jgi:hypothetical protein
MTEQKKRGPKPKHPEGFNELHLKFSGDLWAHIQQMTGGKNYQAYFDELVKRDLENDQRANIDR